MDDVTQVLLAAAVFGAVVLAIGFAAARGAGRSPDEYFLAGRTLGALVLFMALFGTNCSPFLLVGIPGQAYHDGVVVFSMNAPAIALVVPLSFFLVGRPARRMAARLGAVTPVELYARRLRSDGVAWLMFLAFTAYTIPYMITGVEGLARTVAARTEGAIPERATAAAILLLALAYTALGGMRATAWTNVVQGAFFLAFMVLALVFLIDRLGGFSTAVERIRANRPELLFADPQEPRFSTSWLLSYGLVISLTVIAFPHMLVRLMAARDDRSMKGAFLLYPPALFLLWSAAVGIGVFGTLVEGGLEGRASDRIFGIVTDRALPAGFGTLGVVAVLAAVMSTLDAQILTLSSMLTRDVVPRIAPDAARGSVRAGRIFAVAVALAVFVARELFPASIFAIATFAFSGYVTLVPTLYLALTWRRFTAAAAIASIAGGNLCLLLVTSGAIRTPGFHPGFSAFLASLALALAIPRFTRPPAPDALEEAFGGRRAERAGG